MKAGPEEMEAMDLQANPDVKEAAVELQEVCNEEMNMDTLGGPISGRVTSHRVLTAEEKDPRQ
jgi:hypothetical protein